MYWHCILKIYFIFFLKFSNREFENDRFKIGTYLTRTKLLNIYVTKIITTQVQVRKENLGRHKLT